MNFRDPVQVYRAANHWEANLLADALATAEIEAFVSEDHSSQGIFGFGAISSVNRCEVWVERNQQAAAAEVIAQFEAEAKERAERNRNAPDIEVRCEECGKTSMVRAALRGTTQDCPHCGRFVDVA